MIGVVLVSKWSCIRNINHIKRLKLKLTLKKNGILKDIHNIRLTHKKRLIFKLATINFNVISSDESAYLRDLLMIRSISPSLLSSSLLYCLHF